MRGQIVPDEGQLVDERLGIAALEHRLCPPAEGVLPLDINGFDVFGADAGRGDRSQAVYRADLSAQLHRPVQPHCAEMRQQHMMAAQQCLALVLPEGRKAAGVKPAVQRDLRFIERAPELDPVAERGKADPCVILEPRGEFRVQEPALLKQAHGQIPVIQIDEGRDAAGQQLVDHAVIMIDGQLVDRAHAVREDPRPGQGHPVGILPRFLHVLDIGFVVVVEKTAAVRHFQRIGPDLIRGPAGIQLSLLGGRELPSVFPGEVIHDAFGLAVPVPRPLRLKRRIRSPDQKILRQLKSVHKYAPFHSTRYKSKLGSR